MRKLFLMAALAAAVQSYAGPDINKDTYPTMDEEAKNKAASKQDFLWPLQGIAKPSKLLVGDFAIKRVGILSSMLNAAVEQKERKYADSYSETTVYSYQSYSPAMMQGISNRFHDQLVEALKRHGFEVAPAQEVAKAPGIGQLTEEFKDKDVSDRVSWYVPSSGSTKIGNLAASGMAMRKEWMSQLAKDTKQQMLLHTVNSLTMAQGKKEEVEGVKGLWINVSMAMFNTYWMASGYLIEAAQSAGLYNGFWKNIMNGGVIVNHSKLLKTRVFLPYEAIADKAQSDKFQEQNFTSPLMETQAVLADLNVRGLKQALAK